MSQRQWHPEQPSAHVEDSGAIWPMAVQSTIELLSLLLVRLLTQSPPCVWWEVGGTPGNCIWGTMLWIIAVVGGLAKLLASLVV